jgi:hypothetical protein
MNVLRYPPKSLIGDYARAAIGLAFTLTPSVALGEWTGAHWVLVPLAALFAAFAYRTWRRGRQSFTWDATGVSLSGPGAARLAWDSMRDLRLAFYSTSRDRTGGWMQLRLTGGGAELRADSSGEGFAELVAFAHGQARARGLTLDPATISNLDALGIARGGDAP